MLKTVYPSKTYTSLKLRFAGVYNNEYSFQFQFPTPHSTSPNPNYSPHTLSEPGLQQHLIL